MAVDLQELLLGSQASTLDSGGKAHVQTMDLQAKVSIKKYDEVDLGQAIAMKEAGKTGAHTDPRLPVAFPVKGG